MIGVSFFSDLKGTLCPFNRIMRAADILFRLRCDVCELCVRDDGWMDGWLVGWLDGWLVGWMVGWLVGWMGGWSVGWINGWLVCWLDGQMVGWLDGCLDGWMVGWLVGWLDGEAAASDAATALVGPHGGPPGYHRPGSP